MIKTVVNNAESVYYVPTELYDDDLMWTFDMKFSSEWESLNIAILD